MIAHDAGSSDLGSPDVDPAEVDELVDLACVRAESLLDTLAREVDALDTGTDALSAVGAARAQAWTAFADATGSLQEAPAYLWAAGPELQAALADLMGALSRHLQHDATLAGSAHAAGNRVLANCLQALETQDEGANYDALGLLRRMVGRPVGYALHARC